MLTSEFVRGARLNKRYPPAKPIVGLGPKRCGALSLRATSSVACSTPILIRKLSVCRWGVVTFLDYGCVQAIPPDQHEWAVAVHKTAIARDEQGFAEAGKNCLGPTGAAGSDRPALSASLL